MSKKDRYQVSLKLILRDEKGRILAMAKDKGTFAGLYDFPGGRVEVDEFRVPFSDIIWREAREELGDVEFKLDPRPVAAGRHLIPEDVNEKGEAVPEIHVLYLFFGGRLKKGEVRISEEHSGFKWLEPEEIRRAPEKYFKSGNLEGIVSYLAE